MSKPVANIKIRCMSAEAWQSVKHFLIAAIAILATALAVAKYAS